MPTGRPQNLPRAEARAAGRKYFKAENPCRRGPVENPCGDTRRYVSNAECVTCAIRQGMDRYHALDDDAREALRLRSAARYAARVAARVARRAIPVVDDSDFI